MNVGGPFFVLAIIAWAVIPFNDGWVLSDINVAVLYVFAVSFCRAKTKSWWARSAAWRNASPCWSGSPPIPPPAPRAKSRRCAEAQLARE